MWLIWMEIMMFSCSISKLKERVVIVKHSELKLVISPARCAGEAAHLETLRFLQSPCVKCAQAIPVVKH